MGQDLARSPQQLSASRQRIAEARSRLGGTTTRSSALDLAARLIHQFPTCRPAGPDEFADSVARILQRYPLGVVEEACDPTCGVALGGPFLSLDMLYKWLENRMADYTEVAYPRLPAPDEPDNTDPRVSELLKGLADALRADNSRSPLDELIQQKWDMRRLRTSEMLAANRMADEAANSVDK